MQMDKGHSMTPPITNGLFSKTGMELIERDGELLGPLLPMQLVERSGIEEDPLLGITSQACHAQRHSSQANPPTHAFLKE
jgi:hypothetical protein